MVFSSKKMWLKPALTEILVRLKMLEMSRLVF